MYYKPNSSSNHVGYCLMVTVYKRFRARNENTKKIRLGEWGSREINSVRRIENAK